MITIVRWPSLGRCLVLVAIGASPLAVAQTAPTRIIEPGQVIVTAQSRVQRSQDVPISMDVLDGSLPASLQATDLSRLNLFVPGLQVEAGEPTQARYRLRGVETSDYGIGTESAVGVFVDGVQQSRSGGALMLLNDVARVEILKGPQGALFGRNTAAGAVAIISNEPSDALEARGRVRVGNHGHRYSEALLNIPLDSAMALRLSVVDNRSSGWIRDAATGQRFGRDGEWNSRASWRWDVTPSTRILLAWTHDRLRQPGRTDIGLVPMSADTRQRPPFPADPSGYLDPRHAPLYSDTLDGHALRNYDAGTLTVRHDLGFATLASISNVTGYRLSHTEDADGTNHVVSHLDTGVAGYGHSVYQELKLSGSGDAVTWITGASYAADRARQTNLINATTDTVDTLLINRGVPTGTPDGSLYGYFDGLLRAMQLPYRLLGEPLRESIHNHARSSALSIYGDVTWHLDARLNLTLGLRATRDVRHFRWYTPPREAPGLEHTLDQLEHSGVLALAAQRANTTAQALRAGFSRNLVYADAVGQHVNRSDRWTDVSPRLVLDYHFSPRTMGYASLAKGYKAGGYNGVQVNSGFVPEQAWNLETGFKTHLPDHDVWVDASLFAYRYDHRQALTLIPDHTGVGVPQYRISNTDQQAVGLDLRTRWQPLVSFGLGLDASAIDATYRRAVSASGVDLTGQPAGEPLLSWAIHANYRWTHVAGGDVTIDARHGYRGRSRCNGQSILQGSCAAATPFTVGGARQRTDLRLGWDARDDRWGIALYVNNVFNQRYVESIINVSTEALGTPYAIVTRPWSWGIELRAQL